MGHGYIPMNGACAREPDPCPNQVPPLEDALSHVSSPVQWSSGYDFCLTLRCAAEACLRCTEGLQFDPGLNHFLYLPPVASFCNRLFALGPKPDSVTVTAIIHVQSSTLQPYFMWQTLSQ